MKLFLILIVLLVGVFANANGLVINASEIGIGKFHRLDNQYHPYGPNNVFRANVLPSGAGPQTPIIYETDLGVTIQFSTLEELFTSIVKVSSEKQMKVSVLNIHGHGMPGGMWYPKNAAQLNSFECRSWRTAALAADKVNYDQYYTPVTKFQIMSLRQTAQTPAHYGCVVGVPEFKDVTAKVPAIKTVFANDAQIHFISCLVGLGPVGEAFTNAIATLLLTPGPGMVKASLNFGLGDWSMPEGMGFWDYQNDDQLKRDNKIYPVNRRDRDVMQKGTIRVSHFSNGKWISSLVADQDFLLTGLQRPGFFNSPARILMNVHEPMNTVDTVLPEAIVIPGTGVVTPLIR